MQNTKRIRYLTRLTHFYLALIIGGAIIWGVRYQITKIRTGIEKINVTWEVDGAITFKTMSDGPFVIVALVAPVPPGTAPNIIAELPKPIVIVESTNITLTKKEVGQLIWYERLNREKVAAPTKDAPVKALYYKALSTGAAND